MFKTKMETSMWSFLRNVFKDSPDFSSLTKAILRKDYLKSENLLALNKQDKKMFSSIVDKVLLERTKQSQGVQPGEKLSNPCVISLSSPNLRTSKAANEKSPQKRTSVISSQNKYIEDSDCDPESLTIVEEPLSDNGMSVDIDEEKFSSEVENVSIENKVQKKRVVSADTKNKKRKARCLSEESSGDEDFKKKPRLSTESPPKRRTDAKPTREPLRQKNELEDLTVARPADDDESNSLADGVSGNQNKESEAPLYPSLNDSRSSDVDFSRENEALLKDKANKDKKVKSDDQSLVAKKAFKSVDEAQEYFFSEQIEADMNAEVSVHEEEVDTDAQANDTHADGHHADSDDDFALKPSKRLSKKLKWDSSDDETLVKKNQNTQNDIDIETGAKVSDKSPKNKKPASRTTKKKVNSKVNKKQSGKVADWASSDDEALVTIKSRSNSMEINKSSEPIVSFSRRSTRGRKPVSRGGKKNAKKTENLKSSKLEKSDDWSSSDDEQLSIIRDKNKTNGDSVNDASQQVVSKKSKCAHDDAASNNGEEKTSATEKDNENNPEASMRLLHLSLSEDSAADSDDGAEKKMVKRSKKLKPINGDSSDEEVSPAIPKGKKTTTPAKKSSKEAEADSHPSSSDDEKVSIKSEDTSPTGRKKGTEKNKLTPSNAKIEKYKSYLRVAGIRIQSYAKLWENCKTLKSKAEKLLQLLHDAGLDGAPTIQKCKKLRKKIEKKKEIGELDVGNIIETKENGNNISAVRPTGERKENHSSGSTVSLNEGIKALDLLKQLFEGFRDSDTVSQGLIKILRSEIEKEIKGER